MSAKTGGDFAGVMSQYHKIPHIKAAARIMGQVAYGLNEGRGNLEPLMRTLLNTAGSMVADEGPMESLADLAVMEGVASTHANPYATGTRLRQAVKGLRVTTGPHGEWLKKQGADKGTHRDRLKAIKPAIMAEVAKGKGVDQALIELVTDDYSVARSLQEQLGDIDLMDVRESVAKKITGSDVMADNKDFLTKNAVGRNRVADANKAAQEYLIGNRFTDMTIAMKNADTTLRDEKKIGDGWMYKGRELIEDFASLTWLTGGMGFTDKMKLSRATMSLVEEGRRVGLSEREIFVDSLGMSKIKFDYANQNATKSGQSKRAIEQMNLSDYNTERQVYMSETFIKDHYNKLSQTVERRAGNIGGQAPNMAGRSSTKHRSATATRPTEILRGHGSGFNAGRQGREQQQWSGSPSPSLPAPPARQGAVPSPRGPDDQARRSWSKVELEDPRGPAEAVQEEDGDSIFADPGALSNASSPPMS